MKEEFLRTFSQWPEIKFMLLIVLLFFSWSHHYFVEGSRAPFDDVKLSVNMFPPKFLEANNSALRDEATLQSEMWNWSSKRPPVLLDMERDTYISVLDGMWLISPQDVCRTSLDKKQLNGTIQTIMHRDCSSSHFVLTGDSKNSSIVHALQPSSAVIHVPQFSTPIIALNVQGGVPLNSFVCISHVASEFCGVQNVSSFSPSWSFNISNAIAIRHVSVKSISKDSEEEVEQLPFFELPQEFTSLRFSEGLTSEEKHNELHLCLSVYGNASSCVYLSGWRIIVDRLDFLLPGVDRDKTMFVPYNVSGPLPLPRLNITFWSHSAMKTARLAVSTSSTPHCDVRFPGTFSLLPFSMSEGTGEEARWFVPPSALEALRPTKSDWENNNDNTPYRLCMTPSFSSNYFIPTALLLQVEPLHLELIEDVGTNEKFGVVDVAVPTASPSLFRVKTKGFSASTGIFLSGQKCNESTVDKSVLNLTLATNPKTFSFSAYAELLVIFPALNPTQTNVVFPSLLNRFVCLYDPNSRPYTLSTSVDTFLEFRPRHWKLYRMKNLANELAYIQEMGIMRNEHFAEAISVLVYGLPATLSVTGAGLKDVEVIPALNCSDTESFLWEKPVLLTTQVNLKTNSSSEVDCAGATFFCNETQLLHLSSAHTSLFPPSLASSLSAEGNLTVEWCARLSSSLLTFSDAPSSLGSGPSWQRTALFSHIVVPTITGVTLPHSTTLSHEVQLFSSDRGWHLLRLEGPVVSLAHSGNATLWSSTLQLYLTPVDQKCDASEIVGRIPVYITSSGLSAVNVSQLSVDATYRFCYGLDSVVERYSFPSFSVPKNILRIVVEPHFPIITALNNSVSCILPRSFQNSTNKSPAILVSVNGTELSGNTVIQLIPPFHSCQNLQNSPIARSSGVPVIRRCRRPPPVFWTPSSPRSNSNSCEDEVGGEIDYYFEALFGHEYLSQLSVDVSWFKVCSQHSMDAPWLPSSVSVILSSPTVSQGILFRRGEYWTDNEYLTLSLSIDAGAVRLPSASITVTQIVMHDIAVFSLWCGKKNRSTIFPDQLELCRTGLRVMLVPAFCVPSMNLPCYSQNNSSRWDDTVMGPLTITDGLLVLPKPPVQVIEWWSLAIEVSENKWKPALDGVYFFSSSSSQLYSGFSTSISIPFPFNTTPVLRTLVLQRSTSTVAFLSGFGVQSGIKMRFGAHCDDDTPESAELLKDVNTIFYIHHRQELNNTALFSNPISVLDSFGAFVVSSLDTPFLERSTPMCLSLDGGKKFSKTFLSLAVEDRVNSEVEENENWYEEMNNVLPGSNKFFVLLEGASEHIKLEDVAGGVIKKWKGFGSGAVIAALPGVEDCRPDIRSKVAEIPIVWRWPLSVLSISPPLSHVGNESLKGGVKKLHLCAISPSLVLSLDVVIFIVPVQISFLSEVPYFFVGGNDRDALLSLAFKRTNMSMCNEANRNNAECGISAPSLWFSMNLLRLRFSSSNNTNDEEIMCDAFENQEGLSKPLIPIFLSEVDHDMTTTTNFFVSVGYHDLPPAFALSSNSTSTWRICISLDGGNHYMNTHIPFVVVTGYSALLLSDASSSNKSVAPSVALSKNLSLSRLMINFEGQLIDSRCDVAGSINTLCASWSSEVWKGYLGRFGWAEGGMWFISFPTLSTINHDDSLTFTPSNSNFHFQEGITIQSGAVISFQTPELRCATFSKVNPMYLNSLDNDFVTIIPPECRFGLSSSTIIRLIASPNEINFPESLPSSRCDSASLFFVLEIHVEFPVQSWALGNYSSDLLGLVWPVSSQNVPEGRYSMCIGDINADDVFTFATLSVVVNQVRPPLRIVGINASNEVHVFQGLNSKVLFAGEAVENGQKVFVGYAPEAPIPVLLSNGTSWSWEHGCEDLSRIWVATNDSVAQDRDGDASFESILAAHQPVPGDVILTTPITSLLDHGWLYVSASVVKFLSGDRPCLICVSFNGGVSFESLTEGTKIRVIPPVIHSVVVADENSNILPQSQLTSSNAMHVQRIPLQLDSSPTKTSFPFGALPNIQKKLMTHIPLYYFSSVLGFSGSGIGISSGRAIGYDAPFTSYPTSVAAVAILRSSAVGSSCYGFTIANDSCQALPIFLLDLSTERLWSPDQEGTRSLLDKKEWLDMNPVALHKEWIDNTRTLIEHGGVSVMEMLQFLSTRPYDNTVSNLSDDRFFLSSESLIVCMSLDGVQYYSSSLVKQEPPKALANEAEQLSSLPIEVVPPLILIPENTSYGSVYARDLNILVTLIALNSSCSTFHPVFSISSLQEVIASEVDANPNIIVVQLQEAGCTRKLVQSSEGDSASVVVLSIGVSANSLLLMDESIPQLIPTILLNISYSFQNPLTVKRMFSSASENLEFQPVRVDFFYSNGSSIEEVFDFSSPQEEVWHSLFKEVPHDLKKSFVNSIDIVVQDAAENEPQWGVLFLFLLFPLITIISTAVIYRKWSLMNLRS